jgi:hypothetical protein
VTAYSGGGQILTGLSVNESAAWLSVAISGSGDTRTLTNSVNISGLTTGVYSAPVIVTAGAYADTYTVELQLDSTLVLQFSTDTLVFKALPGGSTPASQSLTIYSTNGKSISSITLSDDAAWLNVTKSGANDTLTLTNAITLTGLLEGVYIATVTLTFGSSSWTYPVRLENESVPQDSGLAGWWQFDEGSGTTTADRSAGNHPGTLSNAAWDSTGKFGKCLLFNGSTSYVNVGTFDPSTQDLTITCWAYWSGANGSDQIIMTKGIGGSDTEARWEFTRRRSEYTGLLTFCSYWARSWGAFNTELPSNQWVYLAVTKQGTYTTLYLNAQAKASNHVEFSSGITQPVTIGGKSNATSGFNGKIDEVRLYNRALSADEVALQYLNTEQTLPVVLTSFTAQANQDTVVLAWHTATEERNLGWNVWRKLDSETQFTRVNGALLPGYGTTALPHDYEYTDRTVPHGTILAEYYLEQVDSSNTKSYSNILTVDLRTTGVRPGAFIVNAAAFSLGSNPLVNNALVRYTGIQPLTQPVGLELTTISGVVVRRFVLRENNRSAMWDGKDLNGGQMGPGVYLLKVWISGQKTMVKRVVYLP